MKTLSNSHYSSSTLSSRVATLLDAPSRANRMTVPLDTLDLVEELHVYQIELEVQTEELHRALEEIEISRERYFNLFDLAPVGYVTSGKNDLMINVNLTAVALLGTERKWVLGKGLSRFVAPEFTDEFYLHRANALKTGIRQRCEIRMRRNDGSEFDAQLESVALLDDHENLRVLNTTISDITVRKEAERALRQSEERLNEAQTIARIGSWEMDLISGASIWSDELSRIMPFDPKTRSDPATAMLEIFHPDDRSETERAMKDALSTGSLGPLEARIIRQDGEERMLLCKGRVMYDNNGIPAKLVGIYQDITEQKQLEAQASRSRELEEINKLRDSLLASVSHELRTPLTVIKGIADTLVQTDVEWDRETEQDFLRTINRESDVLTHIIEDLMQMSRMEAGITRMSQAETSIDVIMNEISEQLNSIVHDHHLQIRVLRQLPGIYADRMHIGQVITNLVSNAVAYSDKGTLITLDAKLADDETIVIDVTDQGIGIAPEHTDKIFDRFFRLEPGIARRRGGTGLGLAISKEIVERHGGRIWVDSKLGEGSKFSCSFPVIQDTATPDAKDSLRVNGKGSVQTKKTNRRRATPKTVHHPLGDESS